MVSLSKKSETPALKLITYNNGEILHEFDLTKSKLLLGSFEGADISINDSSISHYHALVIPDLDGGGLVKDLASENGVYINGEKVESAYFTSGDKIHFGGMEFYVEESITAKKIVNTDQNIVKITPKVENVQTNLAPKEGLTIIDGEYCDITFDEKEFKPTENLTLLDNNIAADEFIDFDTDKEVKKTILKESKGKSIEISVLSNHNLISVNYVPIKNRTYYATGVESKLKSIHIDGLDTEKSVPFIKISNGDIQIFDIEKFFDCTNMQQSDFNTADSKALGENDVVIFNHKTIQVFVRIVDTPPKTRAIPFFERDMVFLKEAAKVFSIVMGISLLLLLIDTTIEKPEPKKVAIIYKKKVKTNDFSDKKSKQNPDKVDLDDGIKKTQQSNSKPQFAKKAAPSKKVAKKPTSKKAASKKLKVNKVAKVKTYEFKHTKLSAVLGKSGSLKAADIKATNSNSLAKSSTLNASTKAVSNAQSSNVGTLGSDATGVSANSFGSKGLSSKKGANTAYVSRKTVVLGSMDPELLRRILREYLPQFKHCYQQELENHSENIRGVVNLNFRIGVSGKVSNVDIKARRAKFSNSGTRCMANVLGRIDFPKPKGGGVVDVRQPLNFSSQKTKLN